jgi:hypothetical protein
VSLNLFAPHFRLGFFLQMGALSDRPIWGIANSSTAAENAP